MDEGTLGVPLEFYEAGLAEMIYLRVSNNGIWRG